VKEWGLEDDRCDGEGFGIEVYEGRQRGEKRWLGGLYRNLLDVSVEVTVVILTHYHHVITTAEGRGSEGGSPVRRGGSIDYYAYEG